MDTSSLVRDANAPVASPAQDVWLHAWMDPVAGVQSASQCMCYADLNGDGDFKLLIADYEKKLKVYKGTSIVSEHALLDTPTALRAYYSNESSPKIPAVAVAAGPHVFIYRNLRPFYKYTLPPVPVNDKEMKVWEDLRNGGESNAEAAYEQLAQLRDGGTKVTSRSLDFLALDTVEERAEYVASRKGQQLSQQTVITCMEVLQKSSDEPGSVGCLVLGAENGGILVLDPAGSSVLKMVTLPSAPVYLGVSGLFDVEYRVVAACRDGNVYTVKNGDVTGTVIELESLACGLLRIHKSIIIGCMTNVIHSYHIKGKKNWSVYLPAPILSMELLSTGNLGRNTRCIMVGLANGELRVYNEKTLVSILKADDNVLGMAFGKYGREDNTLILAHRSGALSIKILPRRVDLEATSANTGPPPEQDIPLNIPKKTKLYVEQTQREREQCVEMHRIFQRDLCKLRLSTARAYVKVLTDGQGPLSYTAGSSLRLNAQVQGLGPLFKIKLSIQNTGSKAIANTPVTFSYNKALYYIKDNVIPLPVLVPGPAYKLEVGVKALDVNGAADAIRIFVSSPVSAVPVISAVVNMPVSDALLADE
mmetsp:Transcript_16762/g.42090  ORF Transcript_16762/g.42090 Transcript_16762/m.42090 type:complete len:590 (-) Transcript_16762:163-1932(-)|eukprot:CAMPEP_0113884346 /NCGR_PEP_ID=MMETSP0780_2-20120614/10209_1 /TAXON_ID=652834 /ORGANISM="Palpitomonas bilix" /LENGTH=589 /DNA_ID=CAMNT_0000871961 /DNA_START=176 /DNA_END=1945 /DNA_ORIENTATION=- /assembly_acc=CAM_ASM_000599